MVKIIDRTISGMRENSQKKRVDILISLFNTTSNSRILDLGGGYAGTGSFISKVREKMKGEYYLADINSQFFKYAEEIGINTVLLQENKKLPFFDKEFDLVICNSVIEHVTVSKNNLSKSTKESWHVESFTNQKWFANEIKRIAKAYFVQTPNRNFPLELHTLLPLVGLLNHQRTESIVGITNKFWIRKIKYIDWNLLNISEMKALFPEAKILVEKMVGIPKSIIAYKN